MTIGSGFGQARGGGNFRQGERLIDMGGHMVQRRSQARWDGMETHRRSVLSAGS
ncbi:hypothetical protein [Shinella fusca]|uniref:Uncharacterized protein n=1 Tax=Shinella fusca TaxID=544480 RepID=A0A7W7YRN8_9HYPH|nr:hypothetical protein [Shinella fusca]MBB5041109.1 hypothetical protein [Shinella fusca]